MTPPTDMDSTPDTAPSSPDPADNAPSDDSTNPDVPDIPPILDWILGVLVVIGGLLSALGGLFVFLVADRESIETVVTADDFQVEGMTEAEFVDLMVSFLPWLATGLIITGLAMTVLGIAYIVHRRRVHARDAAGEPTSDYPAHALLGAVVSTLTSFIPLSPIIGGGLAGYLERGDSTRTVSVGAASGVILSAPALVVGLFGIVGFILGFTAIGGSGFVPMTVILIIVGGIVSFGVSVLLGAAGGWIGGKLAER